MSDTQFNGLSPAEAERLAMLAEEASEVAKIAMKIMRHGYSSYNPDDPGAGDNRDMLGDEMVDLLAVFKKMNECGDLLINDMDVRIGQSWRRKLRYAHHQVQP